MTYERDAPTALQYGDDIFVVQSFSKYFNMTGLAARLGDRAGAFRSPGRGAGAESLPVTADSGAVRGAGGVQAGDAGNPRVSPRRIQAPPRFPRPALESLGFRLTAKPEGAFYIYADCSQLTDDSDAFARRLLETAGVAVTPGLDFGKCAPKSHLRFAYTTGVERLAEAVERIRRFL